MPGKTSYYLHTYARGVDKRTVFLDDIDRTRFFLALSLSLRPQAPNVTSLIEQINNQLLKPRHLSLTTFNRRFGKPQANILSAILMPNHFHLHFMAYSPQAHSRILQRLIGSYTKYFNARYQREGHLFSSATKKVPIITDDQNLYLTKYIHLNPAISSKLNVTLEKLAIYRWSTYPHYLGQSHKFAIKGQFSFDCRYFCNPVPILKHFKSIASYRNFVLEQENFSDFLTNKELIDPPK